jgi:uncharacterized protein (DUF433 family)
MREIPMARYPLNLPAELKRAAEEWAATQGVSLNQFIMWAVAERVGALRQNLDDPAFPQITYRRGAKGVPTPVLRGTGIHVHTVVMTAQQEGFTPEQISTKYDLTPSQVSEALAFYDAHRAEIDAAVATESERSQQAILDSIRQRRFFHPLDVGAPDSTTLLREDRAR